MLKHIAAVGTAAMLAVAGSWGTATATPTAPAAPEPTRTTMYAALTPAGHHARACSDDACTEMAVPDPAPATFSGSVTPRADTPSVARSDCPKRSAGAGYRVSTPVAAPIFTLALDDRNTHAGLHAGAPDRARSASACAG